MLNSKLLSFKVATAEDLDVWRIIVNAMKWVTFVSITSFYLDNCLFQSTELLFSGKNSLLRAL